MQAPEGDYEGTELEATAQAHNYNRWILDSIRPFLGPVIAEVGAGQGNFTRELAQLHPQRLVAIEPSANLFPRLQHATRGIPGTEVHHGTLDDVATLLADVVDSVVYINVLEHIADDQAELAHAHRLLKPGGTLCIFVPALPWLMTPFDASIGHHRRYRRSQLEHLVRSSGYQVLRSRYFDLFGVLGWLIAFKLLRLQMRTGNVRFYDRFAVPLARVLDRLVQPPLGKSLLLIARKPLHPDQTDRP